MKTGELQDNRIRAEVVNSYEREFIVVWRALTMIGSSRPFNDLLRLEVERAAATLLHLLRMSDCIDPTIALDGTGSLDSTPADL